MQLQEPTRKMTDTSLGNRATKVLDVAATVGERGSFYVDRGALGTLAALDGNLAQLSALCCSLVLDTVGLGLSKVPVEDLNHVGENFVNTIDDKELQECVRLAIDVLTHPEKNRDFGVTNDGNGPKFGKKDTLRKIKARLKQLNSMSLDGDTDLKLKKNTEKILVAAQSIVHLKLKIAKGAKISGIAANVASIAANITGVIGTSGASLVPWVVNVVASNLSSASSIVQATMGKTCAGMMQQTKGILSGDSNQLEDHGIILTPDALMSLRQCNRLAIDVLTHPEKNRDFEGPGGANFGKKDTKKFLQIALDKFDTFTRDVTDAGGKQELAKIKQDIQTAYDIVSSKLNKAKVTKGLKISGAVFATAASIAAAVATFGAGAIAIPTVISTVVGALGTTIGNVQLAHELLQNKH
jgi:hypothetical protein